MKYQLTYHHDISADLARMPADVKKRIKTAIETRLVVDPLRYGLPLRKSLHGYRKLRVGDYRVIYRVEDQKIIVFKIGHRKDVYPKVIPRLAG
jgi:mRNA interferase RelE/StbE